MSEAENHHHGKNEIIIIKRHRGDHDSHHGGAWKIAFADFMTAMMAFFLVMWLVNAANEETKASLASYFNPVPLSDDTPASPRRAKAASNAAGFSRIARMSCMVSAPRRFFESIWNLWRKGYQRGRGQGEKA